MEFKEKQLDRVMQLISILTNDERPSFQDLQTRFSTSKRTIQRDISTLKEHNIEVSVQEGVIRLHNPDQFSKVTFNELEELMLFLSLKMAEGVTTSFQKRAKKLMSKILLPEYETSYLVKLDPYEEIDINSEHMDKIESAIKYSKVLTFTLDGNSIQTSPLKIMNIDEVWYLFGRDRTTKKFTTYYIKDMQALQVTQISFNEDDDVDDVIEGIQTPWYTDEENFQVEVEVLSDIAYYFKRKKHLNSQKILEERVDGSLLIAFSVTNEEEVDNLIKSWLPHIKVIAPESLALRVKNDITKYLEYLE